MEDNQSGLQESAKKSHRTWAYVLVTVGIVALVGLVAWALMRDTTSEVAKNDTSASSTANESDESTPSTSEQTSDTSAAPKSVKVEYTDNGFAKTSYTVAKGGTVKVVNDSSNDMEFSSDDHPTHLENSELNQGTLASGESQEFNVDTTGTWGIHDHLNSSHTTTLIVE